MEGMTPDVDRWADQEMFLREHMNRTILSDPRFCFEQDGGPVVLKADLYLARLIGFEDEVVDDTLVLPRAMHEYLVPIPERPTMVTIDSPPPAEILRMRVARYVLQSSFATTTLVAPYIPPGTKPNPETRSVVVAFLRYRRRA